ncbi:carbohydrate-binding domain-containing protein [Terriglobus albidus]|uniref:carbohydrate-binding domain-containing protein n=1 Tax=Terriglobus albidus TaxID=1592106 RepID=UPI0021E005B7|nr:carbohydrate-binding domain-containing protein [Terriglobus albidus]
MKNSSLYLALLSLVWLGRCFGQADMYGKGYDPSQSYTHFGTDSVNVYSQNVILHVPLLSYDQLGKLPSIQLVLTYNAPRWHMECLNTVGDLQCYWGPVGVQGVLPQLSTDITVDAYDQDPNFPDSFFWGATAPDGSLHELYDVGGGQFHALDGSGAKWVPSTSTLYDANGTRYMSQASPNSYLTEIRDVFGNKMDQFAGGWNVGGWTDSIQRSIPEPGTPSPFGNAQPGCLTTNYPKFGGGTAPYVFCYSTYSLSHPASYPPTQGVQYHPYSGTAVLLSSITLPNQKQWQFQYDNLGNLSTVTFPTGGQVSYVYGNPATDTPYTATYVEPGIPATVIKRTENASPQDSSQAHTWKYHSNSDQSTRVTEPSGDYADHYFNAGDNGVSISYSDPFPFGYESKVVQYGADGTKLKTTETQYTHLGRNPNFAYTSVLAQVGVFPALITTTWPDGEVSSRCIVYDVPAAQRPCGTSVSTVGTGLQTWDNSNSVYLAIPLGQPQAEFEYDSGVGGPSALLRQTNTTYMALSGPGATTYFSNNILHIPYTVQVQDVNGVQASLVTYGYDDSAHLSVAGTYGAETSVKRWIDPNNPLTTTTTWTSFNGDGTVSAIKDARGNSSTFTYQCSGLRRYEATNALQQKHRYGYDCSTGLLTSEQDANDIAASRSTSYSYNSSRDLISISNPDGGSTTLDYGNYANPLTITETKTATPSPSVVTVRVFDGFRRLSTESITGGATVSYTYDSNGHLSGVSNPYFSIVTSTDGTTTSLFDGLGRKRQQTQPDGNVLQWSYSGTVTTFTDEAGKKWKRTVDGLGRLVEVIEDSDGLKLKTHYRYDALDNLLDVDQYGNSSTVQLKRRFRYDLLSRLIWACNPEGIYANKTCDGTNWSMGYSYDDNGNLKSKWDARGLVVTFSYDSLDRLTDKTFNDQTPGQHFQYDANGATYNSIGRLSGIYTDADTRYFGNGTAPSCVPQTSPTSNYNFANGNPAYCTSSAETYQYDAMGRQTYIGAQFPSERPWTHHETSIGYDLAGNVISLTYPDGRKITPGWDGVGRLLSVTDGGLNGAQVGYSYFSSSNYFPDGSLQAMTYGSGLTETIGKNNRLQVSSITAVGTTAAGTSTLMSKQYCYICNTSGKNNGNVDQISDLLNSSRTQNFTYDNLNRIASFTTGNASQTYSIDSFGNLSQTGTMTSQLSFDSNNRIISGGYVYDPSGNIVSFNNGVTTSTYNYDAESKIFKVNSGSGFYSYDAEGKRARKDADGTYTEYAYFNGQPIAEKHGDGSWSDYVFANGQRIARIDPKTMVTVRFTNDSCSSCGGTSVGGGNRNLYVNSITINNTTFLPGDPSVSYPATSGCNQNGNNGGIGTLSCNGDMTATNAGGGVITVNAYGSPDYNVYPHMQILINNIVVGEWDVTGSAQNYSIGAPSTVSVRFTNDSCSSCGGTSVGGGDRNLYVKSITIGNTTFLPGDSTVSYPVTSGCNQNHNNNGIGWLTCSGDMAVRNPGNSDAITVNAYGSPDYSIYPHMQVLVNNVVVGEWDVTGSAQNYSVGTTSMVAVRFTNDSCSSCGGTSVGGGDRNLYVNSITIGNKVFLPGDSAISYPVTSGCNQNHNNNGIGWLTCSGDMAALSGADGEAITVNAYGSPDYNVYPHMQLLINNVVVGQWDVTASAQNYSISAVPPVHYYITDHLGTTSLVLSTSNVIESDSSYYPFGTEMPAVAGDSNHYKFTGKERDQESGLDYFGARYMSNTVGRFMSPDPSMDSVALRNPQSWNRYSYTLNNPLKYIDPTGMCWVAAPSGVGTYDWMNTPTIGQTCVNAVATSSGSTLTMYGSNGATDITKLDGNEHGMIDLQDISAQHDAIIDVKVGDYTYVNAQTGANLFNFLQDYQSNYSDAPNLYITEAGAWDGSSVPGHQSHKDGMQIDLRYVDDAGKPVQGKTAYDSANSDRMWDLMRMSKAAGLTQIYAGDETKWGDFAHRPSTSPHEDHWHISIPNPKPPKK